MLDLTPQWAQAERMRGRVYLAFLLLLALPACGAQTTPLQLYREAKAALGAVPAPARAADLLTIAAAEQKHHPTLARADLQQAFRNAVALPAGDWDMHVKRFVELSAVGDLIAQPGGFALAHRLARLGDIRKAWLYNELMATAGVREAGWRVPPWTNLLDVDSIGAYGFVELSFRPAAPVRPFHNIAALARECYQADGSFPYLGVRNALRGYHLSAAVRGALLRLAYAAAGNETGARALPQAVTLLQQGHALDPTLDPQLEMAATAMLPHLQAASQTANLPGGGRRAQNLAWQRSQALKLSGSRLLQLLNKIDAPHAAELQAEYTIFPPHMTTWISLREQPQAGPSDPAAALTQAEAMPEATGREMENKFFALLRLSLRHDGGDPAVRRATDDVLNRLNPTVMEPALPLVAELAVLLKQERSQPEAAEALIRRCLDAAESEAVRRDRRFDHTPARFQPTEAVLFEQTRGGPVRVFGLAAQVDARLAARRAEQSAAIYFRPLFLEQVAAGMEGVGR